MIWNVDSSAFEGWGQEGWVPRDFDPVLRIDGSARKIGQVMWHPTAKNIVASASGEHTVKLWDLANPEDARTTLGGHNDAIQSMAFDPTGTLLATTSRDRKLRLFDPRAGGDAVRTADGHGGIKGARVVWMGDTGRIATTGFSKMSDRQVGIWDAGSLASIKNTTLDQSAGVVMPFWTDNHILFLGAVFFHPHFHFANLICIQLAKETETSGTLNTRTTRYLACQSISLLIPSAGYVPRPFCVFLELIILQMCFLPRRALNVGECEIARAYKVYGSSVEAIAFIVPRRVRLKLHTWLASLNTKCTSLAPG